MDKAITPRKGSDGRALSFSQLLELRLAEEGNQRPETLSEKPQIEPAWSGEDDFSIMTEFTVDPHNDPLTRDKVQIRQQWQQDVRSTSEALKRFELLEQNEEILRASTNDGRLDAAIEDEARDSVDSQAELDGSSHYIDIESHDISVIKPSNVEASFALSDYEFSRLLESSIANEPAKPVAAPRAEPVLEVVTAPSEVKPLKQAPISSLPAIKTVETSRPATSLTPAASLKVPQLSDNNQTSVGELREMNCQLQKLRDQHDVAVRRFNEEKQAFERQKESEMAMMRKIFAEERKKLELERRNLSKQFKVNQMLPNKTERQEIEALKSKLTEQEEVARSKDLKNRLATDRLKKQLDEVNKRNAELMQEVKILESERVSAMNVKENQADNVKLAKQHPAASKERTPSAAKATRPPIFAGMASSVDSRATSTLKQSSRGKLVSQNTYADGRLELHYGDKSCVVRYPNGSVKDVKPDGTICLLYINGDRKTINLDGSSEYYFADSRVKQISQADGSMTQEFSDGQVETVQKNGTTEIRYPDGTVRYLFPNGEEENIFADGTICRIDNCGKKAVEFKDGTREIYWEDMKQRFELDGTVRTVYPDGTRETRYIDGRTRIMDPQGRVICEA